MNTNYVIRFLQLLKHAIWAVLTQFYCCFCFWFWKFNLWLFIDCQRFFTAERKNTQRKWVKNGREREREMGAQYEKCIRFRSCEEYANGKQNRYTRLNEKSWNLLQFIRVITKQHASVCASAVYSFVAVCFVVVFFHLHPHVNMFVCFRSHSHSHFCCLHSIHNMDGWQ